MLVVIAFKEIILYKLKRLRLHNSRRLFYFICISLYRLCNDLKYYPVPPSNSFLQFLHEYPAMFLHHSLYKIPAHTPGACTMIFLAILFHLSMLFQLEIKLVFSSFRFSGESCVPFAYNF